MYWKEVIIGILLVFLIGSAIYWWQQSVYKEQEVNLLQKKLFETTNEVKFINEQSQKNINQKPLIIEKPIYVEKIIEKTVQELIKSKKMPVLAYNRRTKEGEVGYVEISLLPGKGDVLIDVRPFNAIAVQLSARNAATAAIHQAGISKLVDKDIKIEFNIGAEAIGGESAGIAIALATYALITNKEIKEHVAATGTIDEEGVIGKIGGVLPKAEAASKKGATLFLIPRGEGEIMAYTPHYFINPITKEVVAKGEPILRKINVIKEARSRWGLEIQQVSTLPEAIKYALEEKSTKSIK